jgi:flagellar FliL protein
MAGGPQAPAPQQRPQAQQDRRKAPAAPPTEPVPEATPKKGRSPMLPAIVVAVALLGAAFLLRGGGGESPSSVATSPTTAPIAATGDPHRLVALEPITLNLSDGSLAKVAIALELATLALAEEVGEEPGNYGARALDEVIEVFGDHTSEQLAAPGGKAKIKALIGERLAEAYHGDVVAVYFTELVVP